MEIFLTTIQAVVTLFGIGILGFWIIARRILPTDVMHVLPPLVIDIALPCMIFFNIVTGFDPGRQAGWWTLPFWWAGFTVVAGIITLLASLTAGKEFRSEFSLSLFFQNSAFLPVAIISGIFGPQSPYLVDLFIFTMFFPAFFFSTYMFFFTGKERAVRFRPDWRRIINPVMVATLAALLLRLSGGHTWVPGFIISMTESLGKMTIPLIFLIIGGTMYIDYRGKGTWHTGELVKFIIFKNIVMPMVVLVLLCIIRPDYNVAFLIILQSASPPVSAAPIVTEREGGNRSIVNQFLVGSFLSAVVTIPFFIWLFNLFFTAVP